MARKPSVKPENRSKQLAQYYEKREEKLAAVKKCVKNVRNEGGVKFLLFRARQIKGRAKLKNIEFNLSDTWIEAQPWRCAVTGQLFEILDHGQGPLTPTFDRIDSAQGYTEANTQIVCCWYNQAKKHWPEAQIQQLIIAAGKHLAASL